MDNDPAGNTLSVFSKLRAELMLILFAALVSALVSISVSYYMIYIESLNKEKNLTRSLYFEVLRDNFIMWEVMATTPRETISNSNMKLYFCLPYDTSAFKSNSGGLIFIPDKLAHAIDEFYGILFRINQICEWVKRPPQQTERIDGELKDMYFAFINQALRTGMDVLSGLEKELNFDPFFSDQYKEKMEALRQQTFRIHPELKENLGKPVFIYDERQNMMILKDIE